MYSPCLALVNDKTGDLINGKLQRPQNDQEGNLQEEGGFALTARWRQLLVELLDTILVESGQCTVFTALHRPARQVDPRRVLAGRARRLLVFANISALHAADNTRPETQAHFLLKYFSSNRRR